MIFRYNAKFLKAYDLTLLFLKKKIVLVVAHGDPIIVEVGSKEVLAHFFVSTGL